MNDTRYYVFSNIHGNHSLLQSIFKQIDKHLAESPTDSYHIIILGDLIDYGPETMRVLSLLLERQKNKQDTIILLGNHEDMLLSFIKNTEEGPLWLTHGGLETLKSYDIQCEDYSEAIDELNFLQSELIRSLPKEHLDLLKTLPHHLTTSNYIFAHAGTNHAKPLDDHTTHDFIWAEPVEPDSKHPHEKCIVHTHIKCDEPYFNSHRICLPGKHDQTLLNDCIIILSKDKPEILTLE